MDPLTVSAFMGGGSGFMGGGAAPVASSATAFADAGRGEMNFNAPSSKKLIIVGAFALAGFVVWQIYRGK
jgi:hypothetical protein